MLPQLATATFPSQIFWVVLGFFCVYGIMTFFVVPRLKKILSSRKSHIDDLLDIAEELHKKSEKIEKETEDLFTNTKQEILEAEEKLISELERKSLGEKQKLSKEILENTNREIASLKISSEEAFEAASSDLEEILDLAMQKVGRK